MEKEQREKNALEKHARLSRLFKEDRFAFERERKEMINDVISSATDEKMREKLRAVQDSWDKKMKGAGSEHNRFILAQKLFWEHFQETWHLNIQRFNALFNSGSDGKRRP
ncbi:MAG: DUF3135 domain-containing protein [Thermodesulfobacteriota bacterium]